MESILINFPEKMVQQMNRVVNTTGRYASRAELIRASVRRMLGKTDKIGEK